MEAAQTSLVKLCHSKQNEQLRTVLPKLSKYPKYFYSPRQKITIVYDNTQLFVIKKRQTKVFNLGKQFLISELAYNHEKDIVVFLTAEGMLCSHFLVTKTQFIMKKDLKRAVLFDWVYGVPTTCQFFLADESGVRLYKVDEEKRAFKEFKHLSGKYNSFIFDPVSEVLLGFPVGDCRTAQPFQFSQPKYQTWFKMNPLPINYSHDQQLVEQVKAEKSLKLDWGRHNKEIFAPQENQSHFVNLLRINKKCYLLFFFAEEGLLTLSPVSQEKEKEASVKLPSDTIPHFSVFDNMLIVHLRNEGITFIYDLNGQTLQPLVSPFPLSHMDSDHCKDIYRSQFVGERVIHPGGSISKWKAELSVIFSYLKNELQIFDFFFKRKNGKMETLKWLRRDLFKIKEINISKFWKMLFLKYESNNYPESEVINLVDLYSNVFYTLSQEELIPKERLLETILQAVRQALELQMRIPAELQTLMFDLLLEFKMYEKIIFLSHNDVIRDSTQIIRKLMSQYRKTHDMMLATLAVDMTFRSGSNQETAKILMKLERVRDAKKYIKQNHEKLDVLDIVEMAKYIQNPVTLKDYLRFARSFILKKYPAIDQKYLDEAEAKLFPTGQEGQPQSRQASFETKKATKQLSKQSVAILPDVV